MKKVFCDILGCSEEAWKEDIDVCNGYSNSVSGRLHKETFEPFEKPRLRKIDLCKKHFTDWCKLTYSLYIKKNNKKVLGVN